MVGKDAVRTSRSGSPRSVALALVCACLLTATGCAAFWLGAGAAAGAAGIVYVQGELRTQVQAEPQTVEQAAVKALEDMELTRISSKASAVDAEITAETAAEKKIAIRVASEEAGLSSVRIRVGVFGDKALSRRVLDSILERLPEAEEE